ncbi:MAG: hydrolase [Nevskia sp.]|nr:hydrolase [Nevskia sp.]
MMEGRAAAHGRVVPSGFRPHPALRQAHLQTLLPALLRPLPALPMRRERLELPDGDFVMLGWSGGTQGPLAVLIHGLTGGLDSKYLRGLARRLVALGWRTVALELRGAGPQPNRLPRCYNQGDTGDFLHLCRLLRAREPGTPLFAVGWSLGGNVLLKALGEQGEAAPLDGAVAVSAPFELKPCAEHLRRGFARVYQSHLLKGLRQGIRRKHGPVPAPPGVDLQAALRAPNFFAYDDAYTAPINGYRDAEDYYARASCRQYLGAIRRTTLILHAADDPFMVPDVVPQAHELAPQVTLELSPTGGHVGFVGAGRWGAPVWWLERRIPQFLDEALRSTDNGNGNDGPQMNANKRE